MQCASAVGRDSSLLLAALSQTAHLPNDRFAPIVLKNFPVEAQGVR
jgi:hypothetical protein